VSRAGAPSARLPTAVERWAPALFWGLAVGAFFLGVAGGGGHLSPAGVPGFAWAVAAAALGLGLGGLSVPLLTLRRAQLGSTGHDTRLVRTLASDLATCFGAGLSPRGGGTVGALVALPFAWGLAALPLGPRLGVVAALTALSFPVAHAYAAGRVSSLDPQEVVLDEWIGVLIPLAVVPFELAWVAAAFGLFRALDILKPGPVGWADRRVKGPVGVMLDDIVAGLIAAAVLAGLRAML
jgi:phosphatidylglycerophosphatase A